MDSYCTAKQTSRKLPGYTPEYIGEACRLGVMRGARKLEERWWIPFTEVQFWARHLPALRRAVQGARDGQDLRPIEAAASIRAEAKELAPISAVVEDDTEELEPASAAAEQEVASKVRIMRPQLPEIRVCIEGQGRGDNVAKLLYDMTQYRYASRATGSTPYELSERFYPNTNPLSKDFEGNTLHVLVNGKAIESQLWQHVGSDASVGAVATITSMFARHWEGVRLRAPETTPVEAIIAFARHVQGLEYIVRVVSELPSQNEQSTPTSITETGS